MEKKWEKIKDVWLELREDGAGAIVFERENGRKLALMVPAQEEQDYTQSTPLNIIEI